MRKLYLFLRSTTLLSIFLACATLFVFFQKDVMPYLAQKYLGEYGVRYESLEGTLFSGVVVEGFSYENITIRKLRISYNFFSLLRPTPRISRFYAEGVFIDADRLLQDSKGDDGFMIGLNISSLTMRDVEAVYEGKSYFLDLKAKEFTLHRQIAVDSLEASVRGEYGMLELRGLVRGNALHAKGSLRLADALNEKYLGFASYEPRTLEVAIDVDAKRAEVQTLLKKVSFESLQPLTLTDARIALTYDMLRGDVSFAGSYELNYLEHLLSLEQEARYDSNGTWQSRLHAQILRSDLPLPLKEFRAEIAHDANTTQAVLEADGSRLHLKTPDLEGVDFVLHTPYVDANGSVQRGDGIVLEASVTPNKELPLLQNGYLRKLIPFSLHATLKEGRINAKAHAKKEYIEATYENAVLRGFAQLASSELKFDANFDDANASLEGKIESLGRFLTQTELHPKQSKLSIDASAAWHGVLDWKEKFAMEGEVTLPWYRIEVDERTSYSGDEASLSVRYGDNEAVLQKYAFSVGEHRLYSEKPSKVLLRPNGDIELQEFWVYDSVLARGILRTSDMSGSLQLQSDAFSYVSQDANVTLKADLEATLFADGKQKIEGDVVLLGGEIRYVLKKDYAITDQDIIIIQESIAQEEKAKTNRELAIRIGAASEIAYRVKDIDLKVIPELMLYQEAQEQMQLLGMVKIASGAVYVGDKEFELDPSEIYFDGKTPLNPFVNLNLHYYTYDYIDIEVYITNTMNDPVVLFSSKPAMSQEDILSYLLFGGSASSVFDTTSGENRTSLNTILLGAGVKELINRSTPIKIDTLNILTNKEGTLGYEVGARFNKNIRIVYKNDEVSNVILQYSLNKNFRFDIDVKETGQGVSIIYVKDFDLHMPWHAENNVSK